MMKFFAFLLAVAAAVSPVVAGQPIDDTGISLPRPGDYGLHVLTPGVLEAVLISSPAPDEVPDLMGDFPANTFSVTVDGHPAAIARVGYRRRVLYAPVTHRDLRVTNAFYLELEAAIASGAAQEVAVTSRAAAWPKGLVLRATTAPDRYSPAIHVNQEGYVPTFPKVAIVGYYLGTLGELSVNAAAGFDLVRVSDGKPVFHGALLPRRDVGFTYAPKPYQKALEADFSGFHEPGLYRLVVPDLGASLPFRVAEGELMNAARAYALGLYEQRCGTPNALPFTRFTHDACHLAPAEVPMPAEHYEKAWDIIRALGNDHVKSDRDVHQLSGPDDQYYPFVRGGSFDVSGGHHDAGDYSKYTTNSATLVHTLIFAVDALPGVADLDNLGLPESGDGISDVLEEAKWESDFLAKLQDDDGGFYFLVYPRDRRYEDNVLPDHGDPQIVWPKNTAATAAATAALAQCASSPRFKQTYPEVAQRYLAQAKRGWAFLEKAVAAHGRKGAYQRLTHYGDAFSHDDELAWAACELFLATGDVKYRDALQSLYPNPADPSTLLWSWGHAVFAYGNVERSYAFAARTGRLKPEQLDPIFLMKCETELRRAGEDALKWSEQSAYGTSFPAPTKRQITAGWYFSSDQAFDLTVAYQLAPKPEYLRAVLANLNYEEGTNPVNICLLTGLGQRRQREIVSQFARNDERVLPPSGIPLGSLQAGFEYLGPYKTQLRQLSVPADDGHPPYPLYDRWSDAYNVTTEFTIASQGRSLASLAFWAAQTPLKTQPWKAAAATITVPPGVLPLGQPTTVRLASPDLDLTDARVVWEARGQEPAYGPTYALVPRTAGPQWVEAEAALPDGRRVFARATFKANAPVVLWVDGRLPRGAEPAAENGDTWGWIKPATKPAGLESHRGVPQHESALARGIHEHGFNHASETLAVDQGDVLFAYVFIDPQHPPRTIMLEWNDGSNEHRAFWGENLIPYGHMNTPSQQPMGAIPPSGRWVRLDVPAKAVGLEGHILQGLVFRLYDGRVRWDAAGKMTRAAADLGTFHVPPPRAEE